jgi:hypothetical protein
MEHTLTKAEARRLLWARLKRSPELGVWNVVVNTVLEPPNPFQPKQRRLPKKGFVLVAFSILAPLAVFVAFNLWPRGFYGK